MSLIFLLILEENEGNSLPKKKILITFQQSCVSNDLVVILVMKGFPLWLRW